MKEQVFYDPKKKCLWLALKDQRDLINRKWHQNWWISNGTVWKRPKTTDAAEKFTRNFVSLESARYLDIYR